MSIVYLGNKVVPEYNTSHTVIQRTTILPNSPISRPIIVSCLSSTNHPITFFIYFAYNSNTKVIPISLISKFF